MAKHRRSPAPSSDRQKWEGIFKSMVEMLQSLQSQAETLADERKFLGEYIHIQHDHWSSKVRLLQSHVAQLKKEEVKRRKMQVSKLDLLVGMKQSEAVLYKKQYELAETDLEDFRACMENLCAELSELKGKLKSGEPAKRKSGVCGDSRPAESSKGDDQCTAAIEIEIRKLKQSYKRLSSKKESEISALLSEKDFVWNQLKKMESDYTAIIKAKKIEVQQANEAVGKLKNNIQLLQQSVNEKDEMIANLKSRHELDKRMHTEEAEKANEKIEQLQLEIEELQSFAKEKDGLIAKLRSELEMDVRNYTTGKSRFSKKQLESSSKTPSDSNPKRGSRKRVSNSAKENGDQKRKCLIDGSSGSRASAPVNGLVRCSSRRRTRTATPVERPALFHANFKVPKLKDSPSGAL